MLTTINKVKDSVLLAFIERDIILAALGRYKGLLSRIRIGSY